MGKGKPTKQQKVAYEDPTIAAKEQMSQMSQQYTTNVANIQQQSQQSIDQINQSNQAAMAAIQKQLQESDSDKVNYQQSLQEYLKQLNTLQQQYNTQVAARDSQVQKQQEMQTNETNANTTMNNLLAASAIAKQSFAQKTRRRGVIA